MKSTVYAFLDQFHNKNLLHIFLQFAIEFSVLYSFIYIFTQILSKMIAVVLPAYKVLKALYNRYSTEPENKPVLWGFYGNLTNIVGFIVYCFTILLSKEEDWLTSHLDIFVKYPQFNFLLKWTFSITMAIPTVQRGVIWIVGAIDKKVLNVDKVNSIRTQKYAQCATDVMGLLRYFIVAYFITRIAILENERGFWICAVTFIVTSVTRSIQLYLKWHAIRNDKNGSFDYMFIIPQPPTRGAVKESKINNKKEDVSKEIAGEDDEDVREKNE